MDHRVMQIQRNPLDIGYQTPGVLPATPADWAVQWLWNRREVSLVRTGMGTAAGRRAL